jgi:uncharacterized protein YycO
MLQIIYSRDHSFGSVLVRASSWGGHWGHCGIVTPQGTVIEALAFGGVVETSLTAFTTRATRWERVEVECPDPDAAIRFARQQIGKPYDWGGVFGMVAREPWASRNRWFCSELVEASLAAGGRRRFRIDAHRVTPHQSYIVA